jgi:hypothetical protein
VTCSGRDGSKLDCGDFCHIILGEITFTKGRIAFDHSSNLARLLISFKNSNC